MASRLVAARLGFKNKMRMGGLDVIILEKGNGCLLKKGILRGLQVGLDWVSSLKPLDLMTESNTNWCQSNLPNDLNQTEPI